ncbi:hypothetical protein TNCV_2669261 [Trichonephila clavipes]|nr:hypothetical protein TNCV_2669261 [Trichonephila clavipes]
MVSLGHISLAPTDLGRLDDEEASTGEKGRRLEKRRKRVGRERGAGLGWRKGLSPRLEWKDDERRWR